MPGLNGSGPMGQGSKTGRGMGRCDSNDQVSDMGMGMRRGAGCRGGRGFKRGYTITPNQNNSQDQRLVELQEEIRELKDKLKDKE